MNITKEALSPPVLHTRTLTKAAATPSGDGRRCHGCAYSAVGEKKELSFANLTRPEHHHSRELHAQGRRVNKEMRVYLC